MKRLFKFTIHLFVLLLYSVLASFAFPNYFSESGYAFLAFIYLIPIFFIINRSSIFECIILGPIYGFTFFVCYNYWLSTFHPLAILIAPILKSAQYLILFPAIKLVQKIFKRRYYIGQTLVYVSYLYLTQQGFLGYPYGNLTSAVYCYTTLIQIVSITGIWGLAFIMVFLQALIAEMLNEAELKYYLVDIIISILLYALTLTFGFFAKDYYDKKEADRSVKIAAIQHVNDTWKADYYECFKRLVSLTDEAIAACPDVDLVVWSETAFVPSVRWNLEVLDNSSRAWLCKQFVEYGTSLPVPLITGNPEGVIDDPTKPPINEDLTYNWKTYNTVLFFNRGEIAGSYRKQHLVPFTEHFPYKEQLPWLYELLLKNDYKWWEKGYEATVFEYDGLRFSTPICFEDTFGYLSAEFVQNGADILINLSNDFWSQAVSAEVQHMNLSVFRAVENRRPLLRSTNSGITCLVLPSGEIVGQLEPFEQTYGIYDIPIGQKEGLTFYTKYPDLFAKLFVFASVMIYFYGIVNIIIHCYKRNKYKELENI